MEDSLHALEQNPVTVAENCDKLRRTRGSIHVVRPPSGSKRARSDLITGSIARQHMKQIFRVRVRLKSARHGSRVQSQGDAQHVLGNVA